MKKFSARRRGDGSDRTIRCCTSSAIATHLTIRASGNRTQSRSVSNAAQSRSMAFRSWARVRGSEVPSRPVWRAPESLDDDARSLVIEVGQGGRVAGEHRAAAGKVAVLIKRDA